MPYEDLNTTEILQEIYRSVEYHLQEPHLHSGAMFLMLPLRTVLKLGEDHKERLLSAQVSGEDCSHARFWDFEELAGSYSHGGRL